MSQDPKTKTDGKRKAPGLRTLKQRIARQEAYLVYPAPTPNLGNCCNAVIECQVAHSELLTADLSPNHAAIEGQICEKSCGACIPCDQQTIFCEF